MSIPELFRVWPILAVFSAVLSIAAPAAVVAMLLYVRRHLAGFGFSWFLGLIAVLLAASGVARWLPAGGGGRLVAIGVTLATAVIGLVVVVRFYGRLMRVQRAMQTPKPDQGDEPGEHAQNAAR